MTYLIIPGLCYRGETTAQMEAREAAMREANRREEECLAREQESRRAPMPSMRQWAIERGAWQPNV